MYFIKYRKRGETKFTLYPYAKMRKDDAKALMFELTERTAGVAEARVYADPDSADDDYLLACTNA